MSVDREAAAYENLGRLFGHFSISAAVLAAGIGIGLSLASKQPGKRIVWWPPLVALAMVCFSMVGLMNRIARTNEAASAAVIAPKLAFEVIRKNVPPGFDFKTDEASLRLMETNLKDGIVREGIFSANELIVKVVAIPVNNENLVLQRSYLRDRLIGSTLISKRNEELIAVGCTSSDISLAPKLKGSVCGKEVVKVLGLDVSTMPGDI